MELMVKSVEKYKKHKLVFGGEEVDILKTESEVFSVCRNCGHSCKSNTFHFLEDLIT